MQPDVNWPFKFLSNKILLRQTASQTGIRTRRLTSSRDKRIRWSKLKYSCCTTKPTEYHMYAVIDDYAIPCKIRASSKIASVLLLLNCFSQQQTLWNKETSEIGTLSAYPVSPFHSLLSSFNREASSFHDLVSSFIRKASSYHDLVSSFIRKASSFHDLVSSFIRKASSFHELVSSFNREVYSFHRLVSSFNRKKSSFHDLVSSFNRVVSSFHRGVCCKWG
jgi:hypothetical protein